MSEKSLFLTTEQGRRLAWRRTSPPDPAQPSLLWLGGFASDMTGTKASMLAEWAGAEGHSLLRFDYSAHGESSGDFADATLGAWLEDLSQILDRVATGPQILIASSMGAWLALLAARERRDKIRGLYLIAPAPDFTERLIYDRLSEKEREDLRDKGRIEAEESPAPISWRFIKEARQHLIMGSEISFPFPISILHGVRDETVPLSHALLLIERLKAPQIQLRLLGEGDHRLSSPEALSILREGVADFRAMVSA